MVIEIIARAAVKEIIPASLNLKAADWERFEKDVQLKVANMNIPQHMTIEQINQ